MKRILLTLMLTVGISAVTFSQEVSTVTTKSTVNGIPVKKTRILAEEKKTTPVVVNNTVVRKHKHKHKHNGKCHHRGKKVNVNNHTTVIHK